MRSYAGAVQPLQESTAPAHDKAAALLGRLILPARPEENKTMTRPETPLYFTIYCLDCWRKQTMERPMTLTEVEQQQTAEGWKHREGRGWRCPDCDFQEEGK